MCCLLHRLWLFVLLTLAVLPLTDRVALAQSSYSWTTGSSNAWGGAFWTLSGTPNVGPPGSSDNATISVGGVGNVPYIVSVTDSRTINNVTLGNSRATLATSAGGTLTVNGTFALNSGDLDNSTGGLTLNGAFNWGGGTVSGGTVTASNGGSITAGTVSGASSVMLLSAGTWAWSSGSIAPNNGGTLRVDSTATLQLTNNVSFGSTAGSGVVENLGLITKTGGTGSSWVGNAVTLNNTGTLRVTSGSWNVQGGVLNNAGVIDLIGSTFMSVHSSGTLVLNAGASITGSGVISMSDGSAVITVNGNVTTAGGLSIQRGQLNGTGTLTINGSFDLGFFDSNSVTGLTVNAAGGGTWTGTDTPRIGTGTVNIIGGTIIWNNRPINFNENGTLTIGSNGTLDLQGDQNLTVNSGFNPTFSVNGLFKKSGGTSNSAVSSLASLSVSSTGTIDVQTGNLYLHPANITNNGIIKASTGNLYFNNNSGNYTTATLNGTGTLQVDPTGILNITPGNTRSVVQAGGTFTQNGTLNVTSGTFKLASPVTISNLTGGTLTGGVWNVSNATLDLDGRSITNIAAGTTVKLTGSSASITGLSNLTQLTGHFGVLNGNTFTPLGALSNGGSVDVTGTFAGAMTVTNAGVLTGSGTVNGAVTVQSGGTVAPGLGTLSGRGLKVLSTGNLLLQSASVYQWQLNSWAANATAGSGFDQVKGGVAGSKLNLSGVTTANPVVLKILSLNGTAVGQVANYDNTVERSWVIADYSNGNTTGGIVGFSADKFAIDTSGFANDPGSTLFSLSTDANSNRLILTFTPVPEPASSLAAVIAVGGLVGWIRRQSFQKAGGLALGTFGR